MMLQRRSDGIGPGYRFALCLLAVIVAWGALDFASETPDDELIPVSAVPTVAAIAPELTLHGLNGEAPADSVPQPSISLFLLTHSLLI